MSDERLKEEYLRILEGIDVNLLNGSSPGLSGLFLATTPNGYQNAKNKIMIVGSETRGWNEPNGKSYRSLAVYVHEAMKMQHDFFRAQLSKNDSKGNSFHNFTRKIAKRCGSEGLIYANLFCFDWKEGSPIGCPHFDAIKIYSEKLLKAQIKILEPKFLIFANGMLSVKYRRAFFPISGPNAVCKKGIDYRQKEGIPNGQLWEFTLNDRIRAFRIQHPSTIKGSKKATEARNYLVNSLLPAAVEEQDRTVVAAAAHD